MSKQSESYYHNLTAVVSALVVLEHGTRAFYGGSIYVGDWALPIWFSWAAIVAGAYVFYQTFQGR